MLLTNTSKRATDSNLTDWLAKISNYPLVTDFIGLIDRSMVTQPQIDSYWGFNFCNDTGVIHSIKFYATFFTKRTVDDLDVLLDQPNVHASILDRWQPPALPSMYGGITFALKIFTDARIKRGFYFRTRQHDLLTPPKNLTLYAEDYTLESAVAAGMLNGQSITRTYHYFQNSPAAEKICDFFSEENVGQRISYCETDGDIKIVFLSCADSQTNYFLHHVNTHQFKEDILSFCSTNNLQIVGNGRRLRSPVRTVYLRRIDTERVQYQTNSFKDCL